MDSLIDNDDEASSTVESWKWEEIKNSETQRNHRREDNETPNLHTIVSKSDKDSTDSHWATDSSNGFFFLFSRRMRRKTRRDNRSKCTEREANLSIDLDHAVCEGIKYSILIARKCDIWSDVGTYFPVFWSKGNLYFFCSSQYIEDYRSS